jgi:hypothetical protein
MTDRTQIGYVRTQFGYDLVAARTSLVRSLIHHVTPRSLPHPNTVDHIITQHPHAANRPLPKVPTQGGVREESTSGDLREGGAGVLARSSRRAFARTSRLTGRALSPHTASVKPPSSFAPRIVGVQTIERLKGRR